MPMNDPRAARTARHPRATASALPAGLLRDSAEFLRGFVRNPAQVGSVIPSSRVLEQRLVRNAKVQDARTVVELGPGTGGTTAALLRAMQPSARLLAIELDTRFHGHLAASLHDPRLYLELGSAEHLARFLEERRLPAPDAIVSGIPFSTMPPEVSDRIARTISEVLPPGGRFVAYQVRAHVADFAEPYLGPALKEWEWVNIPPVRVFTWTKAG
jgi:phosphatidylethanolamine/phosphatidyl-N-methylethanolamine N-methyltransferase